MLLYLRSTHVVNISQIRKMATSHPHVLLTSPPLFGHIIPLLELAKKLMDHGYLITFILSKSKVSQLFQRELIPAWYEPMLRLIGINDGNDSDYGIADYNIAYRMEPILTKVCEDLVVGKAADKSPLVDVVEVRNGNVSNGQSPSFSHSDVPIVGIITDFNLTAPIQIAHSHAIPGYMFSAFSADLLRHMLALNESSIISEIESTVNDSGQSRQIDPSTNLPVITRETRDFILRINEAVPLTSGFLVNSFREFDPEVVAELQKNLNDLHVPLKFVGPLLAVTQTDFSPATRMLVQWLDEQPLRSVVYVSFGSMVILYDEQVREIARALISNGSPAIWSLRQQQHNLLPPEIKTSINQLPHRGCGIVVLPWVPQRTVLAHPATGAMITHCGWNGTLESIFYGVPTLSWPIMDDQPINAECAVRNSLSVQVPTAHLTNPGAIISSAVIQQHLKELQKDRYLTAAKHWSEVSRTAISSGGSSYQEFHNTFVVDSLEKRPISAVSNEQELCCVHPA